MTNHTTAAEHIAEQSARIVALTAEIKALRQDNTTMAALLLKLPTTDLTPAELAKSLIAGCPQWRQVAVELVVMMAEDANEFDKLRTAFDQMSQDAQFDFARYALTKLRN